MKAWHSVIWTARGRPCAHGGLPSTLLSNSVPPQTLSRPGPRGRSPAARCVGELLPGLPLDPGQSCHVAMCCLWLLRPGIALSSILPPRRRGTPLLAWRQLSPSAKDSVLFSGGDSSKNHGADQQQLQISDLHFDKFTTPATFACWKIRLKTEVCTCSQFPNGNDAVDQGSGLG